MRKTTQGMLFKKISQSKLFNSIFYLYVTFKFPLVIKAVSILFIGCGEEHRQTTNRIQTLALAWRKRVAEEGRVSHVYADVKTASAKGTISSEFPALFSYSGLTFDANWHSRIQSIHPRNVFMSCMKTGMVATPFAHIVKFNILVCAIIPGLIFILLCCRYYARCARTDRRRAKRSRGNSKHVLAMRPERFGLNSQAAQDIKPISGSMSYSINGRINIIHTN